MPERQTMDEIELTEDMFEGWDETDQSAPAVVEEEESFDVEESAEPTEEPEEEVSEETEDEPEEQPEVEEEKPDQTFILKHLDEIREVTRDEVIAYAQKGMDYDRIRSDRDALRTEVAALKDRSSFLEELAEMSGQSVEDLMVSVKAKLVLEDERKKGNNITEEQAKYRVESEMKSRKKAAEPAPEEEPAQTGEQIRREKFKRFIARYPDVAEIPKKVWDRFGDGSKAELTDLYSDYLIETKDSENKELRDKIKKLEREASARRSTGSRKSNGTPEVGEDIFEGW